ncbi:MULTISPECIES: hypothetical protein [unclassified Pseudomonas]|uniref:hypothetical protein n=1 Tax=unclassified Pseudomonas TaxID=196821 RepID=UPI000C86B6A7|nr:MULTISPECIES: hypothetical protein [unclassified Pseudomonas]PMV96492.1 hypothetical protein C1X55_19365 [Pseudomonas sp. GW460-C8]PMW23400.1 hypothetical protein C1X53_12665 [Pseudomonas sp. GW456-E6]PMW24124.1 hypothetical protein C1X40_04720 [Pseudomonas sp. GW456-11-11-14-TSB2]PMW40018.1 hypothetical protein C1X45_08030 [Pseudomonas sp. GW460-7]PMW41129.1 hypothetical protein C1X48_06665 [Pseudomonas sp. FW305-3-2-15-A-R2A1]
MLNVPKALLETRVKKETLHRSGKRLLLEIAGALQLSPESYDVRSNKGGNGVMGEVTLHSDDLYLMVHVATGELRVMYRTCKGRKDYCGGMNHYIGVPDLASTTASERFMAKLKQMSSLGIRESNHQAA